MALGRIAAGTIVGVVTHAVGLTKEIIMLAIVAAVLFLVALIFELATLAVGVLDALLFITAGLLCLALHLAGVGSSSMRGRLRSRI
jgi:MFS-type transporter involved in bile tolerance (Atg22 family)